MTDYIHPNPGYHNYESSVRNALKEPEYLTSEQYRDDNRRNMNSLNELADIKSWAKRTWSRPDTCETTYQFQYSGKDLLERTKSAPTEQLRKNNPHPKELVQLQLSLSG